MTEKKYIISLNSQEEQITEWCYGSCGKAIFAPVFIGHFSFVVCHEENCIHMQEEVRAEDADIVLRTLK